MEKQFFIDRTNAILKSESACPELRVAAENWLNSIGTEKEKEAVEIYITELEEDVTPIENLIGMLESEMGPKFFGEEKAKMMLKKAKDSQDMGIQYCICPACNAGGAILDNKDTFRKLV